jgi:outer membrane protein assembly factor BamB
VKTGKKIWQRDVLKLANRECPEYGYTNSLLIVGDQLFLHPGGPKGASVAALNKNDGSILWQNLDDPLGWATPILIEVAGTPQLVYFAASGGLAVSPSDGKLLWRHPWKTEFNLNVATPIYDRGLLFLSSNYGRGCTLLRLKPEGAPEKVWENLVMQNHFSTCVLYEGHLYGFHTDRLRCVEFTTGKVKWDKALEIGRGSLLIADKHLILLGDQGTLIMAEVTPKTYVDQGRWKALDGVCWSVPVLSHGTLFVRNEKRLLALDLRHAP